MSLTDDEKRDYFNPDTDTDTLPPLDEDSIPNVIIDAPDYASFVKGNRSPNARAYERKVQSILKTGLNHTLDNKNLLDAAIYLHYGPHFAATAGDLADKDERAARMIDMITAPDNPYVAFGLAALAMVGQFARNHEDTLRNVPGVVKEGRRERRARKAAEENAAPNVKLKLPFGRSVSFAFRLRFRKLGALGNVWKIQTRDPIELAHQVFSDEKLLKALAKEGHIIRHES